MRSNETPEGNQHNGDVSAAEVPINHMINITDSDSDFDTTSDDDNDRGYELLSAQELSEINGQQTAYYQHSYQIDWVDWDEYENSQQPSTSGQTQAQEVGVGSETPTDNPKPSAVESDANDSQPSAQTPTISLNNDRINEIKNLMSNFSLPTDNIPLWAQELPDDEWKAFLSKRLDSNRETNDK